MEGSRNRRGGQRQDIHVAAEVLQSFLLLHPEALLFVYNDQAKVGEFHVLLKQSVRSDHHVHVARGETGDDLGLLGPRAEATQ